MSACRDSTIPDQNDSVCLGQINNLKELKMNQNPCESARRRMQFATAIAVFGLSVVFVSPLAAQERSVADAAARTAAMERLSFMVGQWSGDAWAVTGPGARHELRQTESVRYALGGQVLLIEGVGRALTNGVIGDTLFHAVATIDWLPDRGYLMRSYVLSGQYGEFPLEPTEKGYSWAIETPGGTVQYRMNLTPDGLFDERGWFVTADGREVPTFAMLLHRVSER